ncbi:MAG: biopolymer transporter ExbD [Euryarchaeota archaeon]|nr:biopolymer transporter ExbD [Euryarchaeota archaeon]
MAMDISRYRNKLRKKNPQVNLIPLIDVILTVLIFLMVTSSIQALSQSTTQQGKPEMTGGSGPSEYYLIPVAGLTKVIVNGVDMSSYIRNGAIAVHTRVIDEGEIIIRPKMGMIIITTPPDLPVEKAVKAPNQ